MSRQVYIKRNVNLEIYHEEGDRMDVRTFKAEFQPSAQEIVPVLSSNPKDIELAEQLKLLFCERNVKSVGSLNITGNLDFLDRSHPVKPFRRYVEFLINAHGNWPKLLSQIYPTEHTPESTNWPRSCGAAFKIQIQKLSSVTNSYEYVEPADPHYGTINLDNDSDTYRGRMVFKFPNWDMLFGSTLEDFEQRQFSLNVLFSPPETPSKAMEQSWPFVFSLGRAYSFTPTAKYIADGRRREVEIGKQTDLVIVGESGKEWGTFQEYFVAGSQVFQSMVQTKGFIEEQTKRISIPEFGDEVIENLLKYLHYFDMDDLFGNMDLAVEMLQIAERYQVDHLKNGIFDMLLNRPSEDFEIGELLKLYTYTKNLEHLRDLSIKVITALKAKVAELDKSEAFCEFFDSDPDSARELFKLTLQTEEFRQKCSILL